MRAVRVLLSLAAFGLILLAMTPWVDRISPTWWVPVQALGRLWILLAVVVIVVSVFARAWLACGAGAVAIIAALVTIIGIGGRPECTAGTSRLGVMAINAEFAAADVDQIVAAVRRHDIDVLVVTEVTEKMISDLNNAGLAEQFTHRTGQTLEEADPHGTVILSRLPASRVNVPRPDGVTLAPTFQQPALRVDVEGTPVLVRAVHPWSPVPGRLVGWHDGLLDLGEWQRAQRGVPLVLAGDFNASSAHPAFRDARRDLVDTAGFWPRATWPMNRWYPPFVDIDHILVRRLTAEEFGTEDVDGTDHRAVWASLRVCT